MRSISTHPSRLVHSVALALALLATFVPTAAAQNGLVIPSAAGGATVFVDIDGLCIGCAVDDASAVIDASLTTAATLSIPASVGGDVSLAVTFGADQPAGADVGVVLRALDGIVSVDLLGSLTLATYLDGALQETASGSAVLDLTLLDTPDADDPSVLSFSTTTAFDEVRLNVASLASVLDEIEVFYAFAASDLPDSMRSLDVGAGATVSVGTNGACAVCVATGADALLDGLLSTSAALSVGAGSDGSVYLDLGLAADEAGGGDVGFALVQGDGLADSEFLSTLTLTTFLDGNQQESGSGSDLDLRVIGGVLRGVTLETTLPFDLVRLEVGALDDGTTDNLVDVFFPLLPILNATASETGPDGSGLAVRVAPNPVSGDARVALTAEAGPARVELFDALGRRVAVLHDGVAPAGRLPHVLDASGLPTGAYVVRVRGEAGAVSRTVTVAR